MKTLILWQLRQIRVANLIAVMAAAVYFTSNQEPMPFAGTLVMFLGALLHSTFVTYRLCWPTRESAFLHVQSFSRDQVARATWVAALLSGLSVVGMCAFVIWTGLRIHIQDTIVGSPWYVIPKPEENWLPVTLLLHYCVMNSFLLYFWARVMHPFRDRAAGWTLMCFGIACHLKVFSVISLDSTWEGHPGAVALGYVPLVLLLLRNTSRASRTVEVNV